jgi:hypothetical protein
MKTVVVLAILICIGYAIAGVTLSPEEQSFQVKRQVTGIDLAGSYCNNGTNVLGCQVRTLLDSLMQGIFDHEAGLETAEVHAHALLVRAESYENETLNYLVELRKRVVDIKSLVDQSKQDADDAARNAAHDVADRIAEENKLADEVQKKPPADSDPRSPNALCQAVNGADDCDIQQTCDNCLLVRFLKSF